MADRGKPGTSKGDTSVSPPDRPSSRTVDRPSSRGGAGVNGKDAKDRPSKVAKDAKDAKDRPSKVAKDLAAKAKRPPAPRRETLATPSAAARREQESERHAEEVTNGVPRPTSDSPPASAVGVGSVRAWLDANRAPAPGQGREPFRIPAELVVQNTDPAILAEVPSESGGLFELLSTIARRALTLGLAAREPSFHVYVAASPQVMIEDDIVRYAERFAKGRETPPDIVYVHDFDRPEAPKPLMVPAGAGATLVAAMDALIDRLRHEIPGLSQHEEVRKATQKLAHELEGKNREVLTGLETTAKTLGFGIRAVQGGVSTFPILHGKPLSAEQFTALDESTKKALGEAEDRLTTEVEKAAVLVRDQNARFDAAREEAMSRLSEAVIQRALGELKKLLSDFGDGRPFVPRQRREGARRGLVRLRRAGVSAADHGRAGRGAGDARERSRARHASQPLQGEPPRRARGGGAAAGHLRDEPDLPEPLRVPRAARALRRAAHGLHAHPPGLAAPGLRAACSSSAPPTS